MTSCLFLGTGAADISPLLQTEYKCEFRENERRCSSLLVNGTILIDCGPHALDAMEIAGVDPRAVTDLFVTHFHGDHFQRSNVERLAALTDAPLRVHYHADARPHLPSRTVPCPIAPFAEVSAQGYTVRAFPANHAEYPLHYSFVSPTSRFLYATDGAWFLGDTVRAMQGARYDAVFLDATVGDYLGDYRMGEHNSIPMLRCMIPSLRTLEAIRDDSTVCLTHIAHTLHRPHSEIVDMAKREGWLVAHDGLRITVGKGEGLTP